MRQCWPMNKSMRKVAPGGQGPKFKRNILDSGSSKLQFMQRYCICAIRFACNDASSYIKV